MAKEVPSYQHDAAVSVPTENSELPLGALTQMPLPSRSQPLKQEGEDFEAYLVDMVTRGRRVVATTQMRALQPVVVELERVLQFMQVGCPAAFATCFESQGWPTTQTDEMLQAWIVREPIVESRVMALVREIEQVYRDAYYALRRMQHECGPRGCSSRVGEGCGQSTGLVGNREGTVVGAT